MDADRKLLELAAKAAGLPIKPHPNRHMRGLYFVCDGKNWQPLEDNGDAMRLAVELRIDVKQRYGGDGWAGVKRCIALPLAEGWPDSSGRRWAPSGSHFCERYDDHAGDAMAATRYAIVRAAASIGASTEDAARTPSEKGGR